MKYRTRNFFRVPIFSTRKTEFQLAFCEFVSMNFEPCVYVLEHIVSLNYRIALWIFTKLGRDKVLMTPHICIDSWAKSAQGRIQGGAKIGPGGSLLQRTSSSDRKATATYWMHSSDLEAFGKKYCYFWCHWEVKFFTRFGRLFRLSHFGVF